MRDYIKKQLARCAFADLSNFDETINTYHIPKYTKPRYEVGKCYLIRLPNYLINNPNTLLATNWNKGNAPRHEVYKAYVNKMMGSHIYVDCLAFNMELRQDMSDMWSGWLDINELTQLSKL